SVIAIARLTVVVAAIEQRYPLAIHRAYPLSARSPETLACRECRRNVVPATPASRWHALRKRAPTIPALSFVPPVARERQHSPLAKRRSLRHSGESIPAALLEIVSD